MTYGTWEHGKSPAELSRKMEKHWSQSHYANMRRRRQGELHEEEKGPVGHTPGHTLHAPSYRAWDMSQGPAVIFDSGPSWAEKLLALPSCFSPFPDLAELRHPASWGLSPS